ncbi:MAG TPA: tetratricopeptide repeat protein [candidate division Zixibacteria bacterium]|nr:tetratricopeptide repeat protein [candidate division Zixibacteria bacterium]
MRFVFDMLGRCVFHMRTVISIILLGAITITAGSFRDVSQGVKAYDKSDYIEALDKFRKAEVLDPESATIKQNIGLSLYRQKDFERAQEELENAFEASDDPMEKAEIQYNLGNAYFQADSLARAIVHYQKALEFDPSNEDAKYNLELARAILKEFADKEEQEQQQQDQSDCDQDQGENEEQEQEQEQSEPEDGEDEQEQQQPEPEQGEMTPEEAERILDAFKDDEQDMQEDRMQRQQTGRGRGLPDW